MEAKHKAHIKALYKVAKFFGICPWEKPSTFSVVYQISILCITLCFSLVSIYTTCSKNYPHITPLHAFLDLLSTIFAVIQGTSIQLTALTCAKTWRKLLSELHLGNEKYSKSNIIYFELFIIHFLFIARIAWNLCIYVITVGWNTIFML